MSISSTTSMKIAPAFLSISILLFAGCSTSPSLAPRGSENTATIAGQDIRDSWFTAKWKIFSLEAVDNKPVPRAFMEDHHRTVTTIEAGTRRLVVDALFNDGFGGPGPREAIILLVADIKAGKAYRLNGEVRDNLLITWLEDKATGEKISPEASAPYSTIRSSPQMIPIYVPKGR